MFGKKKAEEVKPAAPAPVVPETPKFVPTRITTIGRDVTFEGDFITNDPIEVKGTVKGSIFSKTDIHISEEGFLNGDAKAEDIRIDGTVDGTVVIDNVTQISQTGTMTGSLKTGKFQIDPRAYFDGRLQMTSARQVAAEDQPEDATPIEGFDA